ncbi:MAG: hypothetical protein ABGX16_13255 [Pirellulales bacterium]
MKFALLGSDSDSLALSTAALAAGHELVWQEKNDWQILLDRQWVDLVIVGHGQDPPEVRTEQLISLAKQGVAVLSTHPVVPSVLSYFEIDMARDESGALFRHYHPTTEHPTVAQLATWAREGHPLLGKVQQIVCQRKLANRTRERVLWHFARDVLLLSSVGGHLNRLGALGTAMGDSTYAALSVQMTGHLECAVHWSVGPEDRQTGLELTLVGEQGRILLQLDEKEQPRQLLLSIADKQEELPLDSMDFDPASNAVESMCQQLSVTNADGTNTDGSHLAHRPVGQTAKDSARQNLTQQDSHSTWRKPLLAMELTDTIEISLRRGRMIEVHHQQLTEHMAFKGMMSAFGCGLLMILPMLLLVLGWIMGEMGLSIASYWPHGLLLILGLFLALQVLPWLLYTK